MWFVLPLALALSPQTYLVDDDGAGDFLDLPEAVAATAPGDLLLVAPGTYTAPTVTHDLTIVASSQGAKPSIFGELVVDGVGSFTLVGFSVSNIQVRDCDGRVRIDDCDLLTSYDPGHYGTFVVEDSGVVVISRTHSEPGWAPMYFGSVGLRVVSSDVIVVDSEIHGPDGQDDLIDPDWGYEGIACFGDCSLQVVGSSVSGGSGGWSPKGYNADGASAIAEGWTGRVDLVIQGAVHHLIEGGFDGGGGQRPALEVWDGTVGWSGVSMSPPEVTWPMTVPAEPYFLIVGGDQPGGERRLQAFGAQGLPFLAYFCTGPAAVELPGVLGERLLVAPDKLFAVRATTLQGQHTAAGIRPGGTATRA